MNQVLSWVTTAVNVLGLAVSLCLGFYIVTRTPRSRRSWLAAITLWCLSCLFVYNALALNLPEGRTVHWLRPVALLVVPLWLNTILVMPPAWAQSHFHVYLPPLRLPSPVRQRLGRLEPFASRAVVPLAYVLALALWISGVFPLGHLPQDGDTPAILLSDRTVEPLYPLSLAFLILFGCLALLHLWVSRSEARDRTRRRQFELLFIATVLAGLGGLYLGFGVWLRLPLPSFLSDLAVVAAAALLGYLVAEHHALLEGRAVKQDLMYVALAIGSLAVACVLIAELLYLTGHVYSLLTLIVVIIVAISSLMMYDGVRSTLDRLFYRERFRELRANLRSLAREAGTGQSLPDHLQAIVERLCRTLELRTAFVALREEEGFACAASEGAITVGRVFVPQSLLADEIGDLPGSDAPGLEVMSLLVPLYDGDDQIGALVLGRKTTGAPYSTADLILLDDLADEVVAIIQASQLQEDNAQLISEMVTEFREREHDLQRQMQQMLAEHQQEERSVLEGCDEPGFVALVEDALRRLHDFTYLGEHDLARLQVVEWFLQDGSDGFVTHIDRGKAVSGILEQAVQKLRPVGAEPETYTVPPRAWHQYITLHDAYVLGELNRDIMSKLYISEGTFNRTRRRAVRGVAKALEEMEQEAQERGIG